MFVLINSTPPPFTKDIIAMFECKDTKKISKKRKTVEKKLKYSKFVCIFAKYMRHRKV